MGAEKAEFPIAFMGSRLGVSRSGFYAQESRPVSIHRKTDVRLLVEISAIFAEKRGVYGSPRIHRELRARGWYVGRKRVERLMRENGIEVRRRKKFVKTTDSRHDFPVAENVLNRDFEVTEPNRVWVADITFVPTGEGWLFLAMVLDLFSRRVVGWAVDDRITQELSLAALDMALNDRQPSRGLLHHSDRGIQYAAGDYRKKLEANGIVCSMSRKGNCWDNAPAESFFGTLEIELIDRMRWATRAQAASAIFEYIEVFYNRQRRHSSLGYQTPAEYERNASVNEEPAA
jgi:transposase InsO family protein